MPEMRDHNGGFSCERVAGWDIVTQLLNLGDFRLEDPMMTREPVRCAQREMPPGKARRLSAGEVSVVRAWIRGGAHSDQPRAMAPPMSPIRDADRRFWSFRPLRRPPVPVVSGADRVRTPIDAFA